MRDADHPPNKGIPSPKSLQPPFKKTIWDTTTAPNGPTIGAIMRSQNLYMYSAFVLKWLFLLRPLTDLPSLIFIHASNIYLVLT